MATPGSNSTFYLPAAVNTQPSIADLDFDTLLDPCISILLDILVALIFLLLVVDLLVVDETFRYFFIMFHIRYGYPTTRPPQNVEPRPSRLDSATLQQEPTPVSIAFHPLLLPVPQYERIYHHITPRHIMVTHTRLNQKHRTTFSKTL